MLYQEGTFNCNYVMFVLYLKETGSKLLSELNKRPKVIIGSIDSFADPVVRLMIYF